MFWSSETNEDIKNYEQDNWCYIIEEPRQFYSKMEMTNTSKVEVQVSHLTVPTALPGSWKKCSGQN